MNKLVQVKFLEFIWVGLGCQSIDAPKIMKYSIQLKKNAFLIYLKLLLNFLNN